MTSVSLIGYGLTVYAAAGLGLGLASPYNYGYCYPYGYARYYDKGCYVGRRVWTPYGWRIRRVWVCY